MLYKLIEPCWEFIHKAQFGFRKKFDTRVAVLNFLNIYNQIKTNNENKNDKTYIIMIDIAKCFDSISFKIIRKTIKKFILNKIIQNFLVKYYQGEGLGIFQGDPLSPIIFALISHFLLLKIIPLTNHCQMFADDLILIIKGNMNQINEKLNAIYEVIVQFGLKPNEDKTEITQDLSKIKYLGIYLEKISHLVYNLKKAKETYNSSKQLFNNNLLTNNLKIRLFKSFILSQLTYGLEIYNYKIATLNYLNSWINTCITEICKINRNTPVLIYKTEFKFENLVISINKKKFKFKNKLKELSLPYLEKLIKFNQRINNKINWKSESLNLLKKEIYNYNYNELLNSTSWKVQNISQ
ncbi:protein ykfc [Anaeramoeba flamelloides]|uniref:Protein ykfc n=1 Tax=Anaeramoeba flamelloides TaxID=1746091 RepID=A0ABQ8XB64_9EUKA|nr:protein ykfc [Anaeramoeba flamelloides]